jgi:hypothetical protein
MISYLEGGTRMKRGHIVQVALFVLLAVVSAWGDPVSRELYYSKKTPLSYPATYTLRFSLWNDVIGGTEAWSEEKPLKLASPTLKTHLGDAASLDGVDFSQQLWVQVERKKNNRTYVLFGQRDTLGIVPHAMWAITPAGEKGGPGEQGPQGPTGPEGPEGLKGDKGDTGGSGATGTSRCRT